MYFMKHSEVMHIIVVLNHLHWNVDELGYCGKGNVSWFYTSSLINIVASYQEPAQNSI